MAFWAWTLLARLAGAGKEIAVATALGTSPWKDALVAAWTAPALTAAYGNEALAALLTPTWARQGTGLRRLVAGIAGVQVGLSAAALLWPRALIGVVAPRLGGAPLAAAITLERWLALNVALLGAQALLAARLNAQRRFAWTPAATSLTACAVLATVALTSGWTLQRRTLAVAAAITAGNALAMALLLVAAWHGRRHAASPPTAEARPRPAAGAWTTLGILLLAALILNLVPLAERMAASGMTSGSLAGYDYGERLVQTVFSLGVAPFTVISFTRLSILAAPQRGGLDGTGRRDPAAFARDFEQGWRGLLTLAAPAGVGLAVFASLWTRCVFGWGQFNRASLALTAPVVAIKGAGLGLDAALYYLLFTLYAREQARAKLPVALVLAGANVPLAFWWGARWGVAGLAAAHVAGSGGALGWLGWRGKRELPGLAWRGGAAAGVEASALTLVVALGVRACLPHAAVAGELGGAASCLWALLAASATAACTALCAWRWAPQLWRGVVQAPAWARAETAEAA